VGLLARRAHNRWAQASTLQDLADLTALWLEGRLNHHPNYGRRPDPETTLITPILSRLNRAGFLTSNSQPGDIRHGRYNAEWRQRAWVDGFTDPRSAGVLARAATKAGLIAHVTAPGPEVPAKIPVTTWNKQAKTRVGGRRGVEDVALEFEGSSPAAVQAVCAATQFAIVDPEWGRDDVLWPLLAQVGGVVVNRHSGAGA
jgi:hypothetical protein